MKVNPLEPVYGSTHCAFSVIENKLSTLYRNQEKIYNLLQIIIDDCDEPYGLGHGMSQDLREGD